MKELHLGGKAIYLQVITVWRHRIRKIWRQWGQYVVVVDVLVFEEVRQNLQKGEDFLPEEEEMFVIGFSPPIGVK